jgi:hypothetical protein
MVLADYGNKKAANSANYANWLDPTSSFFDGVTPAKDTAGTGV